MALHMPPAWTQTATPNAALAMPSDPTELMHLAAHINGLASPAMKPWHLIAKYQTFDERGAPKDQGTFEAWWAGPYKSKFSYASTSFNQIVQQSDANTFVIGEQKWPPMPELLILQNLFRPLLSFETANTPRFKATEVKFGDVTLQCLRFIATTVPVPDILFW